MFSRRQFLSGLLKLVTGGIALVSTKRNVANDQSYDVFIASNMAYWR
jgi:hypothetical protein